MADILIKDVKIWERCADCPMAGWDRTDHCLITGRDIFPYAVEGKPSDCPLVELPEHGDLISRDQAFQMMLDRGYQKEAAGVILEVPVIVPASKEETE